MGLSPEKSPPNFSFHVQNIVYAEESQPIIKKSSSQGDTPRYRPNVPWARFLQEKGGGGKGGTWTSKMMVMVMMVVLKAIMIKYTSYLPQQ